MDILADSEFPYMHGRLKEEDWKEIVKAGIPWRDPLFPHGAHALFMDH